MSTRLIKFNINNKQATLEYLNKLANNKQKTKNINTYAEVFTPPELINKMLDDLPVHIWSKSDLLWFDLASGIGNFSILIYYKLLDGLKLHIPNIKKRKKHILENMLYFSEINSKNIQIIKKLFNFNKYNLNIHADDSLLLNPKELWNINKFDIIVCNPPYHKVGHKSQGGKKASLHFEFSEKAASLLANNGFMLFIQPRNWRSITSPVLKFYDNMTFIKLYLNYGRKYFTNAEVNTDYYLLQNSHSNVPTDVHYKYNRLNYTNSMRISNPKFIPNVYNVHVKNILQKISTKGQSFKCIISSDCHKNQPHVGTKSAKFKYPLYNTSANPFTYFSSRPHIDQYKKKVIMSNSGRLEPFYDKGTYGTTQDAMYIIVNTKKQGEIIVNTLNSKLFKFIIKICKWSNYRNEVKLFNFFKYPDLKVTDTTILKYYNISFAEQEYLETI